MLPATRIEGYQIETIYKDGLSGFSGSVGAIRNYSAMSKELAEKEMEELPRREDASYALHLIQNARFIKLLSGEIIDNGSNLA